MPLETLRGETISGLLEQVRERLGSDAVILGVRKIDALPRPLFEVSASPAAEAPVRGLPASGPGGEAAVRGAGSFREQCALVPPIASVHGRPYVIAFVGPTGSGKTTTIAKLARNGRIFGGRRVGLLGLDTYGIGSVERIRAISDLLGARLAVAYETKDLEPAKRKLARCEVVLVDTAGRGPREEADAAATREMLVRLMPDEVHLVLSSGMHPRRAHRLLVDHLTFGVTHLLPTKEDEDPDDRSLRELAATYSLPIRWIATGQAIPADIRGIESGSSRKENKAAQPRIDVEVA